MLRTLFLSLLHLTLLFTFSDLSIATPAEPWEAIEGYSPDEDSWVRNDNSILALFNKNELTDEEAAGLLWITGNNKQSFIPARALQVLAHHGKAHVFETCEQTIAGLRYGVDISDEVRTGYKKRACDELQLYDKRLRSSGFFADPTYLKCVARLYFRHDVVDNPGLRPTASYNTVLPLCKNREVLEKFRDPDFSDCAYHSNELDVNLVQLDTCVINCAHVKVGAIEGHDTDEYQLKIEAARPACEQSCRVTTLQKKLLKICDN